MPTVLSRGKHPPESREVHRLSEWSSCQADIITKTHVCAPIVKLSQFSSLYDARLIFRQGFSEVSLYLFPGKRLLLRARLMHCVSGSCIIHCTVGKNILPALLSFNWSFLIFFLSEPLILCQKHPTIQLLLLPILESML